MTDFDAELYIPHRDRMKLIERVTEVSPEHAVSATTVTGEWPSCENGHVSPLVLVELVTQTISFCEGWRCREERSDGGRGWLVGIKNADFFVNTVPVGSELTTTARRMYSVSERYQVTEGVVKSGDTTLGKITIQAYRSE